VCLRGRFFLSVCLPPPQLDLRTPNFGSVVLCISSQYRFFVLIIPHPFSGILLPPVFSPRSFFSVSSYIVPKTYSANFRIPPPPSGRRARPFLLPLSVSVCLEPAAMVDSFSRASLLAPFCRTFRSLICAKYLCVHKDLFFLPRCPLDKHFTAI